MLEQDPRKLRPGSNCRSSSRSPVCSDPFRSNSLHRSRSNTARVQTGFGEMSFNTEITEATGDYLANSCPPGMGLNISPSVGRFKHGEVPSIHLRGNVHGPPSYSMAPESNYGMFKDEQMKQHIGQKFTNFESFRNNLGSSIKMNSSTQKKSK